MKIILLVNRDIQSCLALNYLTDLFQNHLCRVYYTSRVGSHQHLPQPLQVLAALEQDLPFDLLFPALGGDRGGNLETFDRLARHYGMVIEPLDRINKRENRAKVAEWAPDLIISIRHGTILKRRVIQIPKRGVINLHSGILPDYRGVMATFHALRNGEPKIGTTLHYITDNTIDTGPIIGKTSFEVHPEKSYFWHVLRIYKQGCNLVRETVNRLAAGPVAAAESRHEAGNYYSYPDEEALRDFQRQGRHLFHRSDLLDCYLPFLEEANRVDPHP